MPCSIGLSGVAATDILPVHLDLVKRCRWALAASGRPGRTHVSTTSRNHSCGGEAPPAPPKECSLVSTDQPPSTGHPWASPGPAPLPPEAATSGAQQTAPPYGAPAASLPPGPADPQGYPAGHPGPYPQGYAAGHPGPYQQGYPPYGAVPGPYPDPRSYDGFALAGFIFSLLGGLLGIVFGIMGIRRTRDGRARGRGLAIAAVVIGCAWAILYVIGAIGTFRTLVAGPTSSYTAGDCVKVSTGAGQELESEVAPTLPKVACDEPHNGEVIAAKDLPAGPYPGEDPVLQDAEAYCLSQFESFVGLPFDDSQLDMFYVYPQQLGWSQGDHEVACVVTDAENVTGSLRHVAR
jgi:hypothetical protein